MPRYLRILALLIRQVLTIKMNFKQCSNLKDGIGVPWAGQVKAILELRVLFMVIDSILLANLGFVDPIGSDNKNKVIVK